MNDSEGGRRSGEAYVAFPSEENAEHALQEKNRQEIKGRYIEMFRSSAEERDRVLAKARSEKSAGGGEGGGSGCNRRGDGRPPMLPPNAPTLVLRGLPFSAKVPDVVSFL